MTIGQNLGGWGTAGRYLLVYRLNDGWDELGMTWECRDDADLNNDQPDCPNGEWVPQTSWASLPSDSVLISDGVTGEITVDVTADVRAFLADTVVNVGWMFKLQDEGASGTIKVYSRESAGVAPQLRLTTESAGAFPPTAPDTLASWVYAPSNVDRDSPNVPAAFIKNIVVVQFLPSASVQERQDAVAMVGGTVVGGIPAPVGEGLYYLDVPDTLRGLGLQAAARALDSLPHVQLALMDVAISVASRQPKDGTGWQDWSLNRTTAAQSNWKWGVEAIRAPLAWGCSSGDPDVTIADVDGGFPTPFPTDLGGLQVVGPPVAGLPPLSRDHGIIVSSVLAAAGNNGTQMTGVMWHGDRRGYEVGGPLDTAFVARVLGQIKAAAIAGSRVINLPLTFPISQLTPSVDTLQAMQAAAMGQALDALATLGYEPLLVVSAGNSRVDARWSGFPRLAAVPGNHRVIVVGAIQDDGRLWDDGQFGGQSAVGPLITVVAPGKDVGALTQTGQVVPTSGTSVAAPLISGIAGLLFSFDPRLTRDEVYDLILDGALAGGWVDSDSGYPVANAYESLKLAAGRPGAPVCGFPVRADNSQSAVVLERPGGAETIPLPGPVIHGSASVAQGGKVISALSVDTTNALNTIFWEARWQTDGTWALSSFQSTKYYDRIYLERDTVYAHEESFPTGDYAVRLTFARHDGTIDSIPDLYRTAAPGGGLQWAAPFGYDLSMDGRYVVAGGAYWDLNSCAQAGLSRWALIPVPYSGGFATVYDETTVACGVNLAGLARWSPDNTRFALPLNAGASPTELIQKGVDAQGNLVSQYDVTVPNYVIQAGTRYSSAGDTLYTVVNLLSPTTCEIALRAPTTFSILGFYQGPCGYTLPYIPNAPARFVHGATGTSLRERWRRAGSTQVN